MKHSLDILEADGSPDKEEVPFYRQVWRVFLWLLAAAASFLVFLLLIAIIRTFFTTEMIEIDDYSGLDSSVPDGRLWHFAKTFADSLQFRTVTKAPRDYDRAELERLNAFLFKRFPAVFNSTFVSWEKVNGSSLLLTIKGSEKRLAPYMLASHLDVVPVQEELWTHSPFLGSIIQDSVTNERVVWGRGAIDDKAGVIGILSAMELLLEEGWIPKRSFYVAFGHDEEGSGLDGARNIGKILGERKVQLDFLIDEGMPVTVGVMPGIDSPVALIGVTEKGWMNVKIETEGTGGHTSIPPLDQAVPRLSRAIHQLNVYPQPSMFGRGPESDLLKYAAHKASWPYKLMYANQWLFGSILSSALGHGRESSALIRTTTAVTKLSGGVKDNVVPSKAWALINHRVHPGQSLKGVLDYDRTAIADPLVKVSMLTGEEPHPISPYGNDANAFKLIASTIRQIHPTAVAVPGILVANTDTRHYQKLTKQIYRMYPFILDKEGISTIHSHEERLSVNNFEATIKYYKLIINAAESAQFSSSLDKPPSMEEDEEPDAVLFKE